jgi:hypothetical protein
MRDRRTVSGALARSLRRSRQRRQRFERRRVEQPKKLPERFCAARERGQLAACAKAGDVPSSTEPLEAG